MLPAPAEAFNGALASPVILGESAEGVVKFRDGHGSPDLELFAPTNFPEPVGQEFLGRPPARQFCVLADADTLSLFRIESVILNDPMLAVRFLKDAARSA